MTARTPRRRCWQGRSGGWYQLPGQCPGRIAPGNSQMPRVGADPATHHRYPIGRTDQPRSADADRHVTAVTGAGGRATLAAAAIGVPSALGSVIPAGIAAIETFTSR